jgi:glycerol-3-phosphate dehydrogenase
VRDDGVDAVDALTGATLTVRARRVVLAAGVWTDRLAAGVALRPSRGSHLLVPAARLGDPRAGVNVRVPGERGRWVFAIPRGDGLVAIGLTDVAAPGPPSDDPCPDPAEETDLLDRASAALDVPLTAADVVGRYAGLRPLAVGDGDVDVSAATADLSRRHVIVTDPESGALAIVGGKLTTYRRMAQDVVDRVSDRPCRTARLPLVGAAAPAALRSVAAPERLVRRYGTEAPAVVALADGRAALLEPLDEGVPACGAELVWAMRHELALTASDLIDRRVRLGLVPDWRELGVRAAAELVATAH